MTEMQLRDQVLDRSIQDIIIITCMREWAREVQTMFRFRKNSCPKIHAATADFKIIVGERWQ